MLDKTELTPFETYCVFKNNNTKKCGAFKENPKFKYTNIKFDLYENIISMLTLLDDAGVLYTWHDVIWARQSHKTDTTIRFFPTTKADEILLRIIINGNRELLMPNGKQIMEC